MNAGGKHREVGPGHSEAAEEAMRFEGRIEQDGKFWIVEIPAFTPLHREGEGEAFAMAKDLIRRWPR